MDDDERNEFEQELRNIRYELLIEEIKSKLQENYYKLEYCTFIYVNQAIYKFASKSKKDRENVQ